MRATKMRVVRADGSPCLQQKPSGSRQSVQQVVVYRVFLCVTLCAH
jgi:hypothetical protein